MNKSALQKLSKKDLIDLLLNEMRKLDDAEERLTIALDIMTDDEVDEYVETTNSLENVG